MWYRILHHRAGKNRPAFALLMLLIVVAIGMLIYYFQLNPIDFQTKRLQKQDPDKYPWVEDWRLVGPGRQAQQPSEDQPQITQTIYFETGAKQQDLSRGRIQLAINPDGMVVGNWSGQYDTRSPRINYAIIKADFQGNIDPSKTYSDEQGRGQSKLFFIAKGRYMILESNYDTGKTARISGYIYVTGWLNEKYTATGKITITADKKNLQAFTFTAIPNRP